MIATAITTISTDESASWKPEETRRPKTFATSTVTNIASPTVACDERARAGQVGDVVAADQRDRRRAEQDGAEEPAAGDRGRGVAEALAHVGGDAAGHGMPHTERGEGDRERRREDEQRAPGDDRRRARRLRRERRHEQQPRADQGADVQRSAADDAETGGSASSPCHNDLRALQTSRDEFRGQVASNRYDCDSRGEDMTLDNRTRWLALIVLCLGDLMIVLDTTIVNVALPSIRADLGFSQTSLAWVVNAYLLTFGGFLLLGGRLGDLFGHRRLFLIGITLFTFASLACGLSSSQHLLGGCAGGAGPRRRGRLGGRVLADHGTCSPSRPSARRRWASSAS